MSSLLYILLSVILAVSLSSGLWLPWESVKTPTGSQRLGTMMELKPVKLHQDGMFVQAEPVSVILHSLYQQVLSFVNSTIDLVSLQFSNLMDSMVARTDDYLGGLVLANLTNVIHDFGFVKSLRFLGEEASYAINVTSHNLTGIRLNFMLPHQVIRGSFKLNLKEVEEDVPRSESAYDQRPEIELPEFGILGDYFNTLATSILNIITVWHYRGSKDRCSEKFLCSANADWVKRSELVPGIITSLCSLVISWALADPRTIIAARSGFLGQDCDRLFPQCQRNL